MEANSAGSHHGICLKRNISAYLDTAFVCTFQLMQLISYRGCQGRLQQSRGSGTWTAQGAPSTGSLEAPGWAGGPTSATSGTI